MLSRASGRHEVVAADFVESGVAGVGEGLGAVEQTLPRGRSTWQGWIRMCYTVVAELGQTQMVYATKPIWYNDTRISLISFCHLKLTVTQACFLIYRHCTEFQLGRRPDLKPLPEEREGRTYVAFALRQGNCVQILFELI